eukprot:16438399-Heterocapsa_arctica.AAC.1
MQRAIASHDRAALWKYARILAGKRIGSHGRVYSAYPTVVPTLRDWTIFLAKSGREGGLGARQVWQGERGDLCRLVEAH